MTQQFDELIQAIDDLESRAAGYVTLPEVESRVGDASAAIKENVLVLDHRTRVDGATGEFTSVTLCRLNRHHPLVQQLTGW